MIRTYSDKGKRRKKVVKIAYGANGTPSNEQVRFESHKRRKDRAKSSFGEIFAGNFSSLGRHMDIWIHGA
jgi:hypothetical protein